MAAGEDQVGSVTSAIECFTGFYQEKGTGAVCGVVLSRGQVKRPFFNHKPNGDYLNGLFELLIERIEWFVPKLNGDVLHVDVHIHHKNTNFKKALEKVIKAADTARGYTGEVRDNVLKHTLTRKDYKRPASYDAMMRLAKLLAETNDPVHRVTLTTCGDSRGPDQLAVYTACQGYWDQLKDKAGADSMPAEAAVTDSN